MLIQDAQADLRRAYTDGGPGVIISGLVWLVVHFVQQQQGVPTAFAVLFFGGTLIFPGALLANRVILRRAKESSDNLYGMLVIESTIAMIAMLLAAWLLIPHDESLVMPIAAIAVGTHYFAFQTAYGMKAFWLLAAIVTVIGCAAIYKFIPLPGGVVLWVAIAEIVFGGVLLWRGLRK